MKVPILDLKAEFALYGEELKRAVNDVLDSQYFIGGPAIGELERELAAYCGCKHAIAISSGTDALLVSLMALDLKPGDEVITTPFTFFASAGVIWRLGAKPVFVDIEPDTFNLDASKLSKAITPRTRAIQPVHLFGQCCDMDEIMHLANRHHLTVIEDACQAIGATYRGRRACSLGHMGCLSFYPTKNLSTVGEGGMVLSSDDELADKVRKLRTHGETSRYHHAMVGGNFRLDTLKAAALRVKMRHFEKLTTQRQENARHYDEALADVNVKTPRVRDYNSSVYHQYSILVENRDELIKRFTEEGIGHGIYYPVPLHLQECFRELGYRAGDLPVSESTARKIVSLPVHPMLSADQILFVAETIKRSVGSRPRRAPLAM